VVQAFYPVAIYSLQDSQTPRTASQSAALPASQRRIEVVVGVVFIVAIVASVVGAIALVFHYATKFGVPDNSKASITSAKTQTAYTNPKYGLTLTLPGEWHRDAISQYEYFCTLSNDDGLAARFRAFFPVINTTLDQYAEGFSYGFQSKGWTLVSDSQIEINGRAAHVLRFKRNSSARDAEVTLMRKWPVMYELLVTGPHDSSAWSSITDALPQSIDVK
jgi:hypothetical protein